MNEHDTELYERLGALEYKVDMLVDFTTSVQIAIAAAQEKGGPMGMVMRSMMPTLPTMPSVGKVE